MLAIEFLQFVLVLHDSYIHTNCVKFRRTDQTVRKMSDQQQRRELYI